MGLHLDWTSPLAVAETFRRFVEQMRQLVMQIFSQREEKIVRDAAVKDAEERVLRLSALERQMASDYTEITENILVTKVQLCAFLWFRPISKTPGCCCPGQLDFLAVCCRW